MEKPLVSICCITYNHAPYIRECLEGFLMQKTNFPFEVLIHDDASTDGTTEIIREYEAKYPDIIKPLCETENQYSKGVSYSDLFQFSKAQGKYIAICEGDDYWIDPLKLQIQVDILEKKPGYGLVYSDFFTLHQSSGKTLDLPVSIKSGDCYSDFYNHNVRIQTLTVCMRADLLKDIPQLDMKQYFCGDLLLCLHFTSKTLIYGIKKKMGVYRVLDNSAIHSKEKNLIKQNLFAFKYANTALWFLQHCNKNIQNRKRVLNRFRLDRCRYYITIGDIESYKKNAQLLTFHTASLRQLCVIILEKISRWKIFFRILHSLYVNIN